MGLGLGVSIFKQNSWNTSWSSGTRKCQVLPLVSPDRWMQTFSVRFLCLAQPTAIFLNFLKNGKNSGSKMTNATNCKKKKKCLLKHLLKQNVYFKKTVTVDWEQPFNKTVQRCGWSMLVPCSVVVFKKHCSDFAFIDIRNTLDGNHDAEGDMFFSTVKWFRNNWISSNFRPVWGGRLNKVSIGF